MASWTPTNHTQKIRTKSSGWSEVKIAFIHIHRVCEESSIMSLINPKTDKLLKRLTIVATITASYFLLTADYGPQPNVLDPVSFFSLFSNQQILILPTSCFSFFNSYIQLFRNGFSIPVCSTNWATCSSWILVWN